MATVTDQEAEAFAAGLFADDREEDSNIVNLASPELVRRRDKLRATIGERGPWVGIKNLGATCYMNSLLQSLFVTPEFRHHILSWVFDVKQRHPQNIAYQLQLLFAKMCHPRRAHVDAKPLIDSFGMGKGAYSQQHDVQELNRKLLDVVQEFIDRAGSAQVIQQLYSGTFRDYKRCTVCGTVTSSPTMYQDLSVAIVGMRTLEEALEHFVKPDTIEGVTCDACDARRTVEKGLAFATVPEVLTVQLRRIDFNTTTFERERVLDDVKLPLSLDMAPLLLKGEESSGAHHPPPQQYKLQTVIAHRGTAYHGHYYCFTRVAEVAASANESPSDSGVDACAASVGGRWVKFNDDRVSNAEASEVEEYIDPASATARLVAKERLRSEACASSADAADGRSSTPTFQDVLGDGADEKATDDEVAMQSLFDAVAAAITDGGRRRLKAGSSYYAVYRRADLPLSEPEGSLFSSERRTDIIPPYVAEALAEEDAALDQQAAELERLETVLPVGVFYRGASRWIEAERMWSAARVAEAACSALAIDVPCEGYARGSLRLRTYSPSLQTCGGRIRDGDTTLERMGFTKEGAPPIFALEFAADADTASRWTNERTANDDRPPTAAVKEGFDRRFRLEVYDPSKTSFVSLNDYDGLQSHGIATRGWPSTETFATPEYIHVSPDASVGQVVAQAIFNVGWSGVGPSDVRLTAVQGRTTACLHHDTESGVLIDDSSSFVGIPNAATSEALYIELASDAPTQADVPAALQPFPDNALVQAVLRTQLRHLIQVTVDYHGDRLATDRREDDDDAAVVSPSRNATLQVDGRRTLRWLKDQVCERFGTVASGTQLLHKGSRREAQSLDATVRSASFGTPSLEMDLVNGEALPPDETYVEAYLGTTPLRAPLFVGKVRLHGDADAHAMKRALLSLPGIAEAVDAARPELVRLRLMNPSNKKSIGPPILSGRTLRGAMGSHGFDDLRIVVQPIAAPDPPLVAASLILRLIEWSSTAATTPEAICRQQDFVTSKSAQAGELLRALCNFMGVPAPSFEETSTSPEEGEAVNGEPSPFEIEFAKAKPYQLTDQRGVATKLPWGLVDFRDKAAASKFLAGFPLRLEQDDLIVVRRVADPWPEGITQAFADIQSGQVFVKQRRTLKGTKDAASSGGRQEGAVAEGETKKKAHRHEPGISMKMVWEVEPEQVEADASDAPAVPAPVSSPPSAAAAPSPPSSSPPAKLSDRLLKQSFDADVHGLVATECEICRCDFEPGEDVVVLPCHHMYHAECLAPWADSKGICPSCRTTIVVE